MTWPLLRLATSSPFPLLAVHNRPGTLHYSSWGRPARHYYNFCICTNVLAVGRRRQAVNCNCQRLLNLVKQRLSWSTDALLTPPHPSPLPYGTLDGSTTPSRPQLFRAAPNHQLLCACQSMSPVVRAVAAPVPLPVPTPSSPFPRQAVLLVAGSLQQNFRCACVSQSVRLSD